LKLSEAIIVKDLIALSRICLLPSDDLSLAETLKSPLFGFDDDALMYVAIDRTGTLLAALEARRPKIYETLSKFIKLSKSLPPYDFFARVLDYKDASGASMRERFYKRLSLEARDALEAFLHQALDHQTRAAPNLQSFLHGFSQGDIEIKREQDNSLSEVRVMTVHGAKGLESPIVILPDTTNIPTRQAQEQLRLLYVAMTRAESRLIVCGPHVGRENAKLKEGCWYDWVKRGLEALEATPETGGRRRVTPSHLLSNPPIEMAVRSPAKSSRPNIFRRGNLIHKLLEILPEIAEVRRRETADKMLSGYTDLPPDLAAQIKDEVFTVLEHADFAHIFAQGSRAEVSLAGSAKTLPDGLYLNAQIDRLCVTDTSVTIVDYKSNRPPPTDPNDVSDLYLGQMAAYRELAREIYPGRAVSCALLWTDGPHLMSLPDSLLDAALKKVAELPIS